MTCPAPHRLPDSLLFPARSTEYLPRCHRKRCAPSRGKWLRELANAQNCDVCRVQANPTPSVPLQQDYAQNEREPQPNLARKLMRSHHLAPLLVRSLLPSSLGKRRSLPDATRTRPHILDSRRLAYSTLPQKTVRFPSARSEQHAPRIFARPRNCPKSRAWMPKRDRLQSLAQCHSVRAPASKFARQFAL